MSRWSPCTSYRTCRSSMTGDPELIARTWGASKISDETRGRWTRSGPEAPSRTWDKVRYLSNKVWTGHDAKWEFFQRARCHWLACSLAVHPLIPYYLLQQRFLSSSRLQGRRLRVPMASDSRFEARLVNGGDSGGLSTHASNAASCLGHQVELACPCQDDAQSGLRKRSAHP